MNLLNVAYFYRQGLSVNFIALDSLLMAGLLLAFGLIWILLFIDCLRREQVVPLFGSKRLARRVWLVSFFLLSVWQLLLYVVVIRRRWFGAQGGRGVSSVVVGLLALILISPMFSRFHSPQSQVVQSQVVSTPKEWAPGQLTLHFVHFNSSISRMGQGYPLVAQKLRVVSRTPRGFSDQVAYELATQLATLPFVEEVDYRKYGDPWSEPLGVPGPDATLFIEFPKLLHLQLLGLEYTRGVAHVTFQQDLDLISEVVMPGPLLQTAAIHADLTVSFNNLGAAVIGSHTGSQEAIARAIAERISAGLKELADEGGLCRRGVLSTPFAPLTELPSLANFEKKLLASESSPGFPNRSYWRLARRDTKVLDDFETELIANGWRPERYDSTGGVVLRARRGVETLVVGPPSLGYGVWQVSPNRVEVESIPPNPTDADGSITLQKPAPREQDLSLEVCYERRLTKAEWKQQLDALGPEVEPNLQFCVRPECWPESWRSGWFERLTSKVGSPNRYLSLSSYAKALGESANERHLLRRAYLVALLQGDSQRGVIESRARDQSVSLDLPSPSELLEIGYLELPRDGSREQIAESGEWVRYFTLGTDDALGSVSVKADSLTGEAEAALYAVGGGGTSQRKRLRGSAPLKFNLGFNSLAVEVIIKRREDLFDVKVRQQ